VNSNRQSRRIMSLVRQLTLTGLIVFITTLTVFGLVLRQVGVERSSLTAEQHRLEEASDQFRHFAAQSRAEMQATLDSMEAEPDVGTAAINLHRSVQGEIRSKPDPAVLQSLVELDTEDARLIEFKQQADGWRARYETVWTDLTNQTSLNKLRGAVEQLGSAVRSTQGRRPSGGDTLNDQLAELARLVEVLSGEEQIDSLADLKDHQIEPLLNKITGAIADSSPSLQSVQDIRIALFGKAADDGTHEVATTSATGFYGLRREALRLQREREKLKTQSSSLFEDIEIANANFAKSAQGRTMALAEHMEATLRGGWQETLVLGGLCSGVFLWLAFRISRGIGGQVGAIEQARAEAEAGRQTTQKLMLEQQAAAAELEMVHKKLLVASRQAGMAEVATGVLHNVGNVLNSVNVSSGLVIDKLKKSRLSHLQKVVDLFRGHEPDLGQFLTADPAGKQVPGFLAQLAGFLGAERSACLEEMSELQKNVDHIKEIVSMQQAYALTAGFVEDINVRELIEDAMRISRGALVRHDINIVSELSSSAVVRADKHKVLQILVNLISNAKHAMKDSPAKTLTLKIESSGERVLVSVGDTGYGIAPENMTRIFAHGFTTKKDGHGFGLHSGALAATELGGSLRAHSDGPGRGAIFTLELPLAAASFDKLTTAPAIAA
jgi:signal transduction histidine kinase